MLVLSNSVIYPSQEQDARNPRNLNPIEIITTTITSEEYDNGESDISDADSDDDRHDNVDIDNERSQINATPYSSQQEDGNNDVATEKSDLDSDEYVGDDDNADDDSTSIADDEGKTKQPVKSANVAGHGKY